MAKKKKIELKTCNWCWKKVEKPKYICTARNNEGYFCSDACVKFGKYNGFVQYTPKCMYCQAKKNLFMTWTRDGTQHVCEDHLLRYNNISKIDYKGIK